MPGEAAADMDTTAQREYWALELGHVVDRIGTLTATRAQLVTFLGTANLLVLGTALSLSKAGLCLVASGIAVLAFVVDSQIRWFQRVDTVRGIVLQRRLSNGEPDTSIQMRVLQNDPVQEAANEFNAIERVRKTQTSPVYHLRGHQAQVVVAVAVVEASGALLALTSTFDLF